MKSKTIYFFKHTLPPLPSVVVNITLIVGVSLSIIGVLVNLSLRTKTGAVEILDVVVFLIGNFVIINVVELDGALGVVNAVSAIVVFDTVKFG